MGSCGRCVKGGCFLRQAALEASSAKKDKAKYVRDTWITEGSGFRSGGGFFDEVKILVPKLLYRMHSQEQAARKDRAVEA